MTDILDEAIEAPDLDVAETPDPGDSAAGVAGEETEPLDPGFGDDEWTPPTREEVELLTLLAQQGLSRGAPEPTVQDPGGFEFDFFADNAGDQLLGLLQERDQYLLDQFRDILVGAVGPLHQDREHAQVQEGMQRIDDIIADHQARDGEFLVPDQTSEMVKRLSEAFWPEAMSRYGQRGPNGPVPTSRASQAALDRAVQVARAWEKQVADAALKRHANELATLAGAGRDAGSGTLGVSRAPDGGDELSLLKHYT